MAPDLATFLAEHPWPAEVLGDHEPLEFLWSFELACPPDVLWQQLRDTSRLNRALEIAPIRLEERDGKLFGETKSAGFLQQWHEMPWNWVAGRTVTAERTYTRGFAHYVRVIYDLVPRHDGVELRAYMGWLPRNWFFRWLLRIGMGRLRDRFAVLFADLGKRDLSPEVVPEILATPGQPLGPEARERLDALVAELGNREVSAEALERLTALIERGDPSDAHRIQARKLAHLWQLRERDVLHVCLHATRLGLLELSWDVICPHCRSAREERRSLAEVPKRSSCTACRIEFGTEGEHAIEVTFRIHPSIRRVERELFCSAQTAEHRHIEVQQVLEPNEERLVISTLGPGRHRMRIIGKSDIAYLEVAGGEAGAVRWCASARPEDCTRGADPELYLVNDTDEQQTFIVEDVNWADEALRPAHLFSYQGFRDLFSEEYIGADVQLAIGEQTILFTDIVGSTRLYLDRGDPQAFMAVRQHFAEVFRIIDEHEGAVVKTIGDATMAAFRDTVHALAAAKSLHDTFGPGRGDGAIRLRISINTGVCIAVNLNSNIDYFGNTVNFAAKLQLAAGAGDIVLSKDAMHAPGVAEYIKRSGATFETVALDLEALGGSTSVYRWATCEPTAIGRRKAG